MALPVYLGTPLGLGLWPVAGGSSDVTVALTGALASISTGSLGCDSAKALSGALVSASSGLVGKGVSASLSGSSVVTAQGAISRGVGAAISGVSATASQGAAAPVATLPLSGFSAAASAGTITVSMDGSVTTAVAGVSSSSSGQRDLCDRINERRRPGDQDGHDFKPQGRDEVLLRRAVSDGRPGGVQRLLERGIGHGPSRRPGRPFGFSFW